MVTRAVHDRLKRAELLRGDRGVNCGDDRQVLVLDTSGEQVRAAVAVGNLNAADHVSVFTPGFTSTKQDCMEGYDQHMNQTRGELMLQGRGDATVATVTWMGFGAPQMDEFEDDLDFTDTVATSDTAQDSDSPNGIDRGGSIGHSEYLNDQTMAQYNVSVIIAESPELTVGDDGRGFGDIGLDPD